MRYISNYRRSIPWLLRVFIQMIRKGFPGFSEAIWQVIITLAIIISTWYSANYFAALEARRDKRRYLLLAWVVMTILLNFIHLGGG